MSGFYRQGCTDGGRRRDIVAALYDGSLKLPPQQGASAALFGNMGRLFAAGGGNSAAGGRSGDGSGQAVGGKRLSVIIPAQNELRTIGKVIAELKYLEPWEIIVIVNGSTDRTGEAVRLCGATTITYAEPLGTDVGRAIGAYAATGDILLFVDGDFVIPWRELLPFVEAVSNTCDAAVNNQEQHLHSRQPWNVVTSLKLALNTALGREELRNSSFVSVPFALNRRALDVIPWTTLLCPPLAYARGVLGGLDIRQVHAVAVDRLNRYRPYKHDNVANQHSIAAMQIIGDHFEALHEVSQALERRVF